MVDATSRGCAEGAAVCIVEFAPGSGADTSFVAGDALARAQAISQAPTKGVDLWGRRGEINDFARSML